MGNIPGYHPLSFLIMQSRADPAFDGDPARLTEEELAGDGSVLAVHETPAPYDPTEPAGESEIVEPPTEERRKFYFDGGRVEVAAHLVYELDPDGKQLRVVRYTDYAAEKVRMLCPTAPELRALLLDLDLAPTGPIDWFAPCTQCPRPCQHACPQAAFENGAYIRDRCMAQMEADRALGAITDPGGQRIPGAMVKYCRACELACPVGEWDT